MRILKNEFVLDGKVQRDIKFLENSIVFNLSATTGTKLNTDGEEINKFTYIRVIYRGPVTQELKDKLKERVFIRIYGKLDSEQYIDRKGKTVYNKILLGEHISKLNLVNDELIEEKLA